MNIRHKILENGITEFLIHNQTHSLLRPLAEQLRSDTNIEFVSYMDVHPLKNEMKLLVKSKKNNEIELVKKAIKTLIYDLNVYKDHANSKIS